jgi:hypothetical protein
VQLRYTVLNEARLCLGASVSCPFATWMTKIVHVIVLFIITCRRSKLTGLRDPGNVRFSKFKKNTLYMFLFLFMNYHNNFEDPYENHL